MYHSGITHSKNQTPKFQHLDHGQHGHVTMAIPSTAFRQRSSGEHYW